MFIPVSNSVDYMFIMFIYNICWYAAKHDKKCKGIHWCTNCWATAQFSGWFSRINSDAYWRYNWGGPRIRATHFALAIKQCGSIKPSYYWYSQFKIQVLARVLSVDVVVLRFRFHGCRRMLLSKPCFGQFMEKFLAPLKIEFLMSCVLVFFRC